MPDTASYQRPQAKTLLKRLSEERRFLQVILGPRQVGKTTLAMQVVEQAGLPAHVAAADAPGAGAAAWIQSQWEAARLLCLDDASDGALLVLDEIQKIPGWSEIVKLLWDEDTRARTPLKVVLLGSAAMLVQQGLSESLTGRFETIRLPHWSLSEMEAAFGFSTEEYIFYGGYPGAAPLIQQPDRWMQYVRDALIETTISQDVLQLSRVDKPALLRRLFELGCEYSGQILSYTKMLGQLQDAGNTTTLAHYLDLLQSAGMLTGLQKYSGSSVRRRSSSPKLQVLNTALMSAASARSFRQATEDRQWWGRMVESAVGAHLVNESAGTTASVTYWRDRNREVDFVVASAASLVAIEVKSGPRTVAVQPGLDAFNQSFGATKTLVVGEGGVPVESFLRTPLTHWVQ